MFSGPGWQTAQPHPLISLSLSAPSLAVTLSPLYISCTYATPHALTHTGQRGRDEKG